MRPRDALLKRLENLMRSKRISQKERYSLVELKNVPARFAWTINDFNNGLPYPIGSISIGGTGQDERSMGE